MRKNLLYIGILLFILGLSTAFFFLPSAASQHVNPVQKQISLASNASTFVAIQMNETGIVETLFTSTSPVDFYFTNATAFGAISSAGAASANAMGIAATLEGNGVYEVYGGTEDGSFPLTYANLTAPTYLQNVTSMLGSGTYYAIFSNLGNATAQIRFMYASSNVTSINSTLGTISLYGTASLVMTVGGLALVALSFLTKGKPKPQPDETEDAQAKKEFDRIEKSSGKKKR